MRRRDFIAGLAGATAWPLVAHAQQRKFVGAAVLTNNLMIAAALLTKRSINDPIVAPFVRARRSTFPLTDQRMLIAAVEKARGNAYRPL